MNADRKRKNRIGKRAMAVVLTLAMLCSVVGVMPATAKAAARTTGSYPYAYTIRNFLSDYQYVAKGDMVLENHTVGGVVSGGNITLGSFGEAMVMPSYAKHIVKTGNLNVTKYEGVPSGYESNTFYYQTMAEGAIPDYLESNFVKGEFVKVDEAFSSLYNESAKMAQDAEATPTKSGETLVVDFSKASSYTIDASLLNKGGNSTVNIIGVDSVDEFTDNEYSISFTGIGNDSLFLDYVWGSNSGYDYYVHILFNGNKFEQEMKKISTANYAGSQFVNSGMKFITNVPDVTELKVNGLSGHLVAPKADVTITGGGFEGGVIAGSVEANVEGHFYPYYKVGGERSSGSAETPVLDEIGGTIIIQQRECSTLKDTLSYDYAVQSGTEVYLESLDSDDSIYYYVDTTGSTTALSVSELDQKTFTPYDPSNPPVLTAEKTVIYEKVVDDKDANRYVYVNSEAFVTKPAQEIVETRIDLDTVYVGEALEIIQIKDNDGDYIIVSPENAEFQWQVKDEHGNWVDIPGANGYTFTPDETLEAKEVQCVVTGTNGYTGEASDTSIVRALPPVQEDCTDTTITIEAEDGFEYQIVDKNGNVVQTWTEDGTPEDADETSGTITFEGLAPSTEYDVVKRKVDTPETESRKTEVRTITKIVKAELFPEIAEVGETVTLISIEDVNGQQVEVNNENATYQWQVKDDNGTWKDIPGATSTTLVPGEDCEGKEIRCHVTGINAYTGDAYAEGLVKALPPVEEGETDTTITVEAEDGFEYELRDPEGNVIVPWTEPEGEDTITFEGLTPDTEYEVVKRTPDVPETESKPTNISTSKPGEVLGGKIIIQDVECDVKKDTYTYDYAVQPGTRVTLEALDSNDTIYYYFDTTGTTTALTDDELDSKPFTLYDPNNKPALSEGKTIVYEKVVDDKDANNYVYVSSEALTVKPAKKIVFTNVDKPTVLVEDTIVVDTIKDQDGNLIFVSPENADFQWQVYDEDTDTWKDIEGETSLEFTPDESLEGESIRCEVTGKNGYTGVVYDESIVRALPPVQTEATEDSITIEAEEGFEYQILDKEGNVVQDWTRDGDSEDADTITGTLTFEDLNPATEYDLLKRKNDVPETQSVLGVGRTVQEIVEATLDPEVSKVGQTVTLNYIEDAEGNSVPVNTTNATYQWQVKNDGTWADVSGATAITFVPNDDLEGKEIRCHVIGINNYGGDAYAEGVVKALPPVEKEKTATSITIEAEDGFEYEIRDPQGNVVVSWAEPNGKDTLTFVGLTPETKYDVVKRTPGIPETESEVTTIQTTTSQPVPTPEATQAPGATVSPKPQTTYAPGTIIPAPGATLQPNASAVPSVSASPMPTPEGGTTAYVDPEDPTASFVRKNSIELNIPTIVMKKVMGPKMKFKIKLLNQKGAKIRCESSNKKLATINKKGLVKTKKKTGKCKLIINVSKGQKRIQYIVNLVVRKSCKKNYSLYKYKTSYKAPSVSLYKLVPRGKSYKIKLKHLNKSAKVVYKSNNKKVATVNKKGKVKPKKNGRADVTIDVTQNGIKYRYFVVVRVTEKGVESNTSYLKVIK